MRYRGLTSSSSDATQDSSSKLGSPSLLPRLAIVLTVATALCATSCSVSRKATSSHSEQLRVLSQESEQVRAERVEFEKDTLIEVLGRAKRPLGDEGDACYRRDARKPSPTVTVQLNRRTSECRAKLA